MSEFGTGSPDGGSEEVEEEILQLTGSRLTSHLSNLRKGHLTIMTSAYFFATKPAALELFALLAVFRIRIFYTDTDPAYNHNTDSVSALFLPCLKLKILAFSKTAEM